MKQKKVRYYHASPYRLRVGTILTPDAREENFGVKEDSESPKWGVFLSDSPLPHFSTFPTSWDENWHIYEVRPIGELVYGWTWLELISDKAEIIRYVGSARGIYETYYGTFLNIPGRARPDIRGGSRVIARRVSKKAKGTGHDRYVHKDRPQMGRNEYSPDYLIRKVANDPNVHKRVALYKKLGIEPNEKVQKAIKTAEYRRDKYYS